MNIRTGYFESNELYSERAIRRSSDMLTGDAGVMFCRSMDLFLY